MKRTLTLCATICALALSCVLGLADNDPPCTAPSITSQPASRTNCQGTTATFTVVAAGTAPLTYRWRTNGVILSNGGNVSGATTSTLTITNVTTSNATNYSVVVSNSCGSVTSSVVSLTVSTPLSISQQPTNQTVSQGGNAMFSVTITGNPASFQWYFNTTNLLAGATNASLILTNVQMTNAGNYLVVVTNDCGSVTSSNALLIVLPCFSAMDVMLVIDRSGSMQGAKFIDATNAASRFVTNFNYSFDRAGVEMFSTADTLNTKIWQVLTNELSAVLQGIANIPSADGETCMSNAIWIAQQELMSVRHNTNALPVLLLLTDGVPEGSSCGDDTNKTAQAANYAKTNGTRIIAIGLGAGAATNFLKYTVASSTNDFYYAPDSTNLNQIYSSIADSLCRGTNSSPSIFVQITSPTNGQLFLSSPTNIVISATATSSGGTITNVAFYQGANKLGDVTTAPYDFVWENVTNGSYSLTAVATDNSGNSATSASVTITVNALPSVTITIPTNNAAFLEVTNVSVSATVADSDGSITNVGFFYGTNTIAITNLTTPFSGTSSNGVYKFTWNGRTNHVYPITAKATDNRGGSASSSITLFTVTPTNQPPTVWITYPTNGATLGDGEDITITASASDTSPGYVTNVQFYEDGKLLGNDTDSPYSITKCCWGSGKYVLMARATDNLGVSSVSSNVTILVGDAKPTSADGFWDPEFTDIVSFRYTGGIRSLATDETGNLYAGALAFGNQGTDDQFFFGANYCVAKWDGNTWSGFFPPPDENNSDDLYNTAFALKAEAGALYIGGEGHFGTNAAAGYVVKWNGTNWVDIGDKLPNPGLDHAQGVTAIAIVGADLFIGGDFLQSESNTNIHYIAKLVGTNWVPVGDELTMPTSGAIRAIASVGNTVYIGGDFTAAGGNTNIQYLAKLVGSTWTNVDSGVNGIVRALAVCDNNLYVGGDFTMAGGYTNANCIAKWDGAIWSTLAGGVSGGEDSSDVSGYSWSIPSIHTITVRGNEVFVGGEFRTAYNGTVQVAVNHVAKVKWSENTQTWTWSSLDEAVHYEDPYYDPADYVHASVTYQRPGTNAYDLYVGGRFGQAGQTWSQKIAHWQVGSAASTNGPTVSITSPANFASFDGDSPPITVTASASASGTNTIDHVEFLLDNQSLDSAYPPAPFTIDTYAIAAGLHKITAMAWDSASPSRSRVSAPVFIVVTNSTSTVVAHNDAFTVFLNDPPSTLDVLANDSTSTTNRLHIDQIFPASGSAGAIQANYDRSVFVYTPNPNAYGQDVFAYSVSDGVSTNLAWVRVSIKAGSRIQINTPYDSDRFRTNTSITFTGTAYDYDGTVTNVTLRVNGVNAGQTTNFSFTFNWSTNIAGFYMFDAIAADNEGITSVSTPVTIVVTNASASANRPVAIITNLVTTSTVSYGLASVTLPVIRDGLFNLRGRAYDPDGGDAVAYQVLLYRPNDWEGAGDLADLIPLGFEAYADVTPGPKNYQGFHSGGDVSGNLGVLDLTAVPNGIYDLVLRVRGGTDETNAIVRVQLDSNLKIGQFSFSEQDLAIPVNGLPLTVTRTYNSLNPRAGDFGYSWTYALNDMEVVIDEDRVTATALDTLEGDNSAPLDFSMRIGGGRNVTLTLPDGHRATFQFTYAHTTSAQDAPMALDGEWMAPPGVKATLSTLNPATKHSTGDDTVFALFAPMKPFWQAAGSFTPLEAYDIPTYVLTTEDGTKFYITRDAEGEAPPTYVYQDNAGWFGSNPQNYYIQPHPGKPRLTKIVQRSGDRIQITDAGIFHYNATNGLTRSVFIERDGAGRISAIFDPNSGVTNQPSAINHQPSMRYVYNRDTGNLIQVQRLTDRTAGLYQTTKYHYDHPKFPHYITSIEDPRGIPLARNEYDDAGRLTAVVDADGKRTQFVHNTTNNVEIVTDRLGNTNSFVYDTRGNVTATTNALGQFATMKYDDLNNKTNDVAFLNGQPYATNNYQYSANLLLASINALGYSNTFTYNANAQLLTTIDARGYSSTNFYDSVTGNPITTKDALGNASTNFFDSRSLLTSSRDPLGTVTTNFYNNLGSLTSTTTLDVSGKILGTNSFAYDANANQTNSVTWRKNSAGTWVGATNTTIFDAQNRVVQSISPVGGTNLVVYNALGKQDYTVDALNHTNRFAYDAQGRLFQTTYPDGSFETSYFDAGGRRTNSVDRAGRATTYVYDSLSRMTQTIFADNTTNRTYYDGVGRMQFSVDARGVTNAFGYDILGRRIAVTNAYLTSVAMTNRFGYDANGNQPYVTNALGVVTTNVLDALNRVTQVQYAGGTKVSTGYDGVGRRVAETNQDNIVTRFGYDGAGRLVAVTNAFGITGQQTVTRYEYDEAGNQTAQIDALLRTNRYSFDNVGRRLTHTMPDPTLVEKFGYDLNGNLIRNTNFNGIVITNQYNVLNQLTNLSSTNGYKILYAYSVTGQRTNMADASGTTSYAYDVRYRLTNCTSPAGVLSYLYDASGNLTNISSTTATGTLVTYQYDALNRVTNVVDGRLLGTQNTRYSYDLVGNLQSYKYPNGLTNYYQYNSLNQLTNLLWKSNATSIASFAYKLGPTGNRTNLAESITLSSAILRTNAWQYDPLYRLTNEVITGTTAGNLTYAYDPVGNRTNRGGSLLGAQTPAFTTNDWVKTDAYDNNGNTRWTTNGTATGPYYYDVENRLTNFGGVTIYYNGDGQRVKKVVSGVTTLYLVDALNPSGYSQVLEEKTAGVATNFYTYGLDLISHRKPGVTTNFFGYDGHGSTRFLANAGGTVANVFAYDAFGTLIASNATAQTAYLYCGEQFDSDLGFYYLRARYLNPNTGRFWTRDSYSGNNQDPLSLHKYLYCHADPVNGIDPSGMMDLIQLQATITTWSGLAVATAYRVAPLANRVTIIIYESVTGSTVVGGAGLVAGGKITMTIVGGGTKIIDPIAKATTEKIALLGFKEAGKYGVWPFKILQKLVPVGSGLEKHHLLEQRFANTLGVAADEIPSIALTAAEHSTYTARWLAEIGRRNMDVSITTRNATIDNIWDAAQEVYHDAPELLEFVKTFLNK